MATVRVETPGEERKSCTPGRHRPEFCEQGEGVGVLKRGEPAEAPTSNWGWFPVLSRFSVQRCSKGEARKMGPVEEGSGGKTCFEILQN